VNIRRALALLVVLLTAACAVLTIVTRDPWPSNDGLTVALAVALAAVGLVVARQQPRNAIAWLLVATGVVALTDTIDRLYLVLDYRRHGGMLAWGGFAVDWRVAVSILPFLIALPAILLFPDGVVPSRRWRRALRMYTVGAAAFSLLQIIGAATERIPPGLRVDVRGNLPSSVNPGTLAGLAWIAAPLFLAFWLGCVGHQAACWRRASGEQRAQLKWLMGGAAVSVVSSVLLVIAGDGSSLTSRLIADVAIVGIGLLPVAIGIGILRYRLYEIDRLISRTLSYSIVTALLAGTFIGLVVLITDVLPFSSPVGVAGATLAAAALFNPLRVRVQHVVDRRFHRARYDAEATVDAFAQHLRDALDLETVEAGLLDAVGRAVEPRHMTVWIRNSA
jgi:hypothetical protein